MTLTAMAVGRALTVGLLALALNASGSALRPVTAVDTGPGRLLPAVADPTGPLTPEQYPPQVRTSSPRPPTGSAGLVWDTSRGYPVGVRPSTRRPSAPRAPGGSSVYTWLLAGQQPGPPPARWSPCAPITVRVNPAGLGPAARAAIRWAFAELQSRSGLQVRLGPDTAETVAGRLSDRDWTRRTWATLWQRTWAPVLVFASHAGRTPELGGRIAGWTSVHTSDGGRLRHIVSGAVALDLENLGDTERAAGQRDLRMLLLHELGHLVGLGHVDDADLVMHPQPGADYGEALTYRHGDLRGLAVAGRGPC